MHTYIVLLKGNILGVLNASKRPVIGSHVNIKTYSQNGSKVMISGFIDDIIN